MSLSIQEAGFGKPSLNLSFRKEHNLLTVVPLSHCDMGMSQWDRLPSAVDLVKHD
jgi:hypothetical protein